MLSGAGHAGQWQSIYLACAVPSTLPLSLGGEESGLNHRMTVCTHVFKCSEAKGTHFKGNSVAFHLNSTGSFSLDRACRDGALPGKHIEERAREMLKTAVISPPIVTSPERSLPGPSVPRA